MRVLIGVSDWDMGFSAAVIEYVYCTIYTHDFPV